MSEHTPGPWKVSHNSAISGVTADAYKADGLIRPWLCTIPIYDHPDNAANAKLIAAAPDLLEACKQWLAQVTGGAMYPENFQADEADCVAYTRAAIAAATR